MDMTRSAGRDSKIDRFLVAMACIMILAGLAHLPIWWWSGQPWEGSISWRKPILFGVSGGLTLWSLAWVWSLLPPFSGDGLAKKVLAVSLVLEVGLIMLQIWRGEPSHFNRSTWWNARVDDVTLVLITVVVLLIISITARSMGRLYTEPVMALAVRAGMLMLVVSSALGYVTSIVGYRLLESSLPPETFGAAGSLKFPHGALLHAIQTLPALVWIRQAIGRPATLTSMRYWIGAHTVYLVYAVWQTSQGFARLQPNLVGTTLIALTGVLGLVAWWPIQRQARFVRH
jgi:hypothetical protein